MGTEGGKRRRRKKEKKNKERLTRLWPPHDPQLARDIHHTPPLPPPLPTCTCAATPARPPHHGLLRHHPPQHRPRHEPAPAVVDAVDAVKVPRRHLVRPPRRAQDPRAVHQIVDATTAATAAKKRGGVGHEGRDEALVRDVTGAEEDLQRRRGVGVAETGDGVVEGGGVDVGQGEACAAGLGKGEGYRRADALRRGEWSVDVETMIGGGGGVLSEKKRGMGCFLDGGVKRVRTCTAGAGDQGDAGESCVFGCHSANGADGG